MSDSYDELPSAEYQEARVLCIALSHEPDDVRCDPTSEPRRKYRRAWERWMTKDGFSFGPVPDDHK